jgi:leucyl aminopeptidase
MRNQTMKLSFEVLSPAKVEADVIVHFVHSDESLLSREQKRLVGMFGASVRPPFDSKDFKGVETDLVHVYLDGNGKTNRLLLAGLGERKKCTLETYRRAASRAAKRCRDLKARRVSMAVPDGPLDPGAVVGAMTEGVMLGLYRFDKYKSGKNENSRSPEKLTFVTEERKWGTLGSRAVQRAVIIAEAAIFARNLANAPGNEIYPETLAKAAVDSGKRFGFKVTVHDKATIRRLGMGGVIGVSQGSARPPKFIVLEYGKKGKTLVLVGKGVTFDTGGISIKPSANMAEMKMDMSGAATVIATMEAVARLRLPVHVVGLIPAVENMPSGQSLRPGDILRHYNGKTSEVDNTRGSDRCCNAHWRVRSCARSLRYRHDGYG